jgi:tetratricopeptide (TPR) repeat protein
VRHNAEVTNSGARLRNKRGNRQETMVHDALSAALTHLGTGHLNEAEALCREVLKQRPRDVAALHCLDLAALRSGRSDQATSFLRRAAKLAPGDLALLTNLGVALKTAGQPEEAVIVYQTALQIAPQAGETLFNLGNALFALRRFEESESAYRRAIAAGNCRTAGAGVYSNLGLLFEERGALDEAIAAHQNAILRRPDFAAYHYNLGNSLRGKLSLDAAICAYDRALALQPDYPDARLNQSLVFLLQGDFRRGWERFEWRLQTNEVEQRSFSAPLWGGEPLTGRRLLLHAEQGLGDTIQCLRYLPILAGRGERVVIEVQPSLRRLVDGMIARGPFPLIEARSRGEVLPAFDCHLPLMSLHRVFRAGCRAVSAVAPYIQPEPEILARWQDRLSSDGDIRIGLVWAGNPQHRNDRNRSIAPAELLPLLSATLFAERGRRFFSLQLGAAAQGISAFPAGLVTDLAPFLHDFAETAGAIAALDLLICVDTSVAHLAGALGRPVRVLLPYAPDWRWLLDRADNIWYPTMRLHRQKSPGAWADAVASVAAELSGSWAGSARPTHPW